MRPALISSSAFRLEARPAKERILLIRSFWGSFLFEGGLVGLILEWDFLLVGLRLILPAKGVELFQFWE
jgi:hypothetical protein